MAKIYLKYSPARRGLTGMEYLPGFLDEQFPTIKFTEVIADEFNRFGFIEGSGDDLAKALMASSEHFAIKQLTEKEFIGYCRLNYVPYENENGDTISFTDFMSNHGIEVSDEIEAMKEAKKNMFKEIVKKKLEPDNESIADIMKSLVLFHFYYNELNDTEKNIVDGKTASLKNVYSKTKCINAYSSLVDSIVAVVDGYYSKVNELESTDDPDIIKSIEY